MDRDTGIKDTNTITSTQTRIYDFQSGIKSTIVGALGVLIGIAGMITAFLVSLLYNPQGSIGLREKVSDVWFWIMWGVIFCIVIIVSTSTYKVSKRDAKEQPKFIQTQADYKKAKDEARPYFHLLGKFTHYKNKEITEIKQQEIIESADLDWELWKAKKYLFKKPYHRVGFWRRKVY